MRSGSVLLGKWEVEELNTVMRTGLRNLPYESIPARAATTQLILNSKCPHRYPLIFCPCQKSPPINQAQLPRNRCYMLSTIDFLFG